jgi:hypothetical protein
VDKERVAWVHSTVVGVGPFPIDMLRYDRAYPVGQDSTNAIIQSMGRYGRTGAQRVTVASPNPLTSGRWETFGWKVMPNGVSK